MRWDCFLLVGPLFAFSLPAQTASQLHLSPGAVVIERASIPPAIHPDRELLLWMISPAKHDRGPLSKQNPYTCPEWTLGSYYSGPTRISLVDTSVPKAVNTIELRYPGRENLDSFDIPYRIVAGMYYLVPGHKHDTEGKPALLALRDLNGDGLPLETAFFYAEACMGLPSTSVGYSPKQDRVIQFETQIQAIKQKALKSGHVINIGKRTTETLIWVDYLFDGKPTRPGQWSYRIDYSGRLGTIDSYHVHYDPSREMFFGSVSSLDVSAVLP
jgi:hypothetical protein